MSKLIKSYDKEDLVQFTDKSYVRVLDLVGTVDNIRYGRLVQMQLYKVLFHNEIYYATDDGLNTRNPDIFKKAIAGVGYRGIVDYKQYPREYDVWKGMVYRCYYKNNNLYPYFGGYGVRMVDEWLCFEIFLYELVNLPSYDALRHKGTSYDIDMSMKQRDVPANERIYKPGGIEIKEFSRTDICTAYNRYRKGDIPIVSNHVDSADQCIDKKPPKPKEPTGSSDFKPYSNGQWPPAAYEAVVNNPPKLPIPDIDDLGYNKIRVFNGVKYSDRPPLKPTKSTDIIKPKGLYKGPEMCKIVDNSKPRNK